MYDKILRKYKDDLYKKIFIKLCGFLKFYHIKPNFITSFSFIMGVVCCFLSYMRYYIIALIFWILNRFLDGLDGKSFL